MVVFSVPLKSSSHKQELYSLLRIDLGEVLRNGKGNVDLVGEGGGGYSISNKNPAQNLVALRHKTSLDKYKIRASVLLKYNLALKRLYTVHCKVYSIVRWADLHNRMEASMAEIYAKF